MAIGPNIFYQENETISIEEFLLLDEPTNPTQNEQLRRNINNHVSTNMSRAQDGSPNIANTNQSENHYYRTPPSRRERRSLIMFSENPSRVSSDRFEIYSPSLLTTSPVSTPYSSPTTQYSNPNSPLGGSSRYNNASGTGSPVSEISSLRYTEFDKQKKRDTQNSEKRSKNRGNRKTRHVSRDLELMKKSAKNGQEFHKLLNEVFMPDLFDFRSIVLDHEDADMDENELRNSNVSLKRESIVNLRKNRFAFRHFHASVAGDAFWNTDMDDCEYQDTRQICSNNLYQNHSRLTHEDKVWIRKFRNSVSFSNHFHDDELESFTCEESLFLLVQELDNLVFSLIHDDYSHGELDDHPLCVSELTSVSLHFVQDSEQLFPTFIWSALVKDPFKRLILHTISRYYGLRSWSEDSLDDHHIEHKLSAQNMCNHQMKRIYIKGITRTSHSSPSSFNHIDDVETKFDLEPMQKKFIQFILE